MFRERCGRRWPGGCGGRGRGGGRLGRGEGGVGGGGGGGVLGFDDFVVMTEDAFFPPSFGKGGGFRFGFGREDGRRCLGFGFGRGDGVVRRAARRRIDVTQMSQDGIARSGDFVDGKGFGRVKEAGVRDAVEAAVKAGKEALALEVTKMIE